MKQIVLTILLSVTLNLVVKAQEFAMDFIQDDCYGNPHHLFEELDQNSVVIIEFFMTNCNPCINAGNQLKPHVEELQSQFPDQVKWYHFGFTSDYDCATVTDWVESHNYNSLPFTDGSAQVAYYGGFGMPTIVVLAGTNHEVIYSEVGYSTGDDDEIHEIILDFFAINSVNQSDSFQGNWNARFDRESNQMIVDVLNIPSNSISLEVLSINGQVVIPTRNYDSGRIDIDAVSMAEGVYIVKMTVDGRSSTSRVVITR